MKRSFFWPITAFAYLFLCFFPLSGSLCPEQILLLDGNSENSRGELSLWEREEKEWYRIAFANSVWIGSQGLVQKDQKREGDGKTPIGIYPIKRIYAKTRVQHFSFPISVFTKSSHWDGDPNSKSYNQFLRHPKKGAVRLWDSPIYALFLVIEHNTEKANQKGAGSMLFVHPWEEQRPTSGCLGLPLEDWEEIAKHLDPKHKPKLIIQEKESPLWSPYSWPISGQETAE